MVDPEEILKGHISINDEWLIVNKTLTDVQP